MPLRSLQWAIVSGEAALGYAKCLVVSFSCQGRIPRTIGGSGALLGCFFDLCIVGFCVPKAYWRVFHVDLPLPLLAMAFLRLPCSGQACFLCLCPRLAPPHPLCVSVLLGLLFCFLVVTVLVVHGGVHFDGQLCFHIT
jgi:hypothetical protein